MEGHAAICPRPLCHSVLTLHLFPRLLETDVAGLMNERREWGKRCHSPISPLLSLTFDLSMGEHT